MRRRAQPNEEQRFELALGDRFTFVSDGVVEARNTKGELLGFERMVKLTAKHATEIAETSQRWGQDDDITVLTVARAPKLEAIPVWRRRSSLPFCLWHVLLVPASARRSSA